MLGFILAISSSFFAEVSDTIGKKKMQKRQAGIYTVGFLTIIFSILFYIFIAYSRGVFQFTVASLPTLIPRIILEIVLSFITITALAKANRSFFGSIRTMTIPLLLIADLIFGYSVDAEKIFGMAIICAIIFFVGLSGRFEKKGFGWLILSTTLPVLTISLYKYNISHFNSVEAEQIVVSAALAIFFFGAALFRDKENPLLFLFKPAFLLQAIMSGLSAVAGGFAYMFLSPSVVVTTLRSGAVLFSTLSGNFYFKEKRPLLKFLVALGIVGGLAFFI